MSEVISIVNIGKTTTTYNLGAAIAGSGKRVLLVDNDSQASLTKAMGLVPSDCKISLATLMCQAIDSPELLEGAIVQAIQHRDKLDLLPANQKLSGIATRLSVMQATASMFSEKDDIIIPVQAHYLDAEGLPDTLELVRRVRATYQPTLSVRGLLLTMYKGRTLLAKAVKEQIEANYGTSIHVFSHPID